MKILIALTSLLSGCATCERHPTACAAGVAFVTMSVALSVGGTHEPSSDRALHENVGPEKRP